MCVCGRSTRSSKATAARWKRPPGSGRMPKSLWRWVPIRVRVRVRVRV